MDLWSFVERFSKKLETYNLPNWDHQLVILLEIHSQLFFRFIIINAVL